MIVVFCSDPLDERLPDSVYQAEVEAAQESGFDHALISFEAIVYGDNPNRTTRRIDSVPGTALGVYRGWMMTPQQYGLLYDALQRKGIQLINDPAAYQHCHYLPSSFSVIAEYTPRSTWMRVRGNPDIDEVMHLLEPFDSKPIIVKDFVGSRKHEWNEACYIPSALDRSAVEKVVRRFLDLQGDDLN